MIFDSKLSDQVLISFWRFKLWVYMGLFLFIRSMVRNNGPLKLIYFLSFNKIFVIFSSLFCFLLIKVNIYFHLPIDLIDCFVWIDWVTCTLEKKLSVYLVKLYQIRNSSLSTQSFTLTFISPWACYYSGFSLIVSPLIIYYQKIPSLHD